jgi:MYXO-CTERM domain-containing protein
VSLASATYGSALTSQFTPSGVTINTAFSPAAFADGASAEITFRQAFTVTEAVTMNWSGLLPTSGGYLRIDLVGSSGVPQVTYWDGANSVLNLAATGVGEYYLISFGSSGTAIASGTALEVSFVPAPGALALLGVACLAARRRRR